MLKILAWIEIGGCLAIGIFMTVYPLASGDSPPSVGIYLRGAAVVIFGLIWGLGTLRREKIREHQTRLEREKTEFLKK